VNAAKFEVFLPSKEGIDSNSWDERASVGSLGSVPLSKSSNEFKYRLHPGAKPQIFRRWMQLIDGKHNIEEF
jgi:hypothetical protein